MRATVDDPAGPPQSLRGLLAALRPGTLTVRAGDTDVAVAEPVICDAEDLTGVRPGDLVLAVGVHDSGRATAALLRRAAAAGACAVVVATDQALDAELNAAAEECHVVLLSVPRDVSWGRLFTLLRTVVSGRNDHDTSAGVPGGDLFRLADAIAAMVGGPVVIEDPRSVVLAYSTGDDDLDEPRRAAILGRRVSGDWQQHYRDTGLFKRLWNSDEALMVPGTAELRPRLVIAVRAAGEVLGSIWVAEAGRPFDEAARTALSSAARLAALHLLRHRETEDLDRRHQADALIALLEHGTSGPGNASFAIGMAVTVVAVEPQSVDGPDAVAVVQRLDDLVGLICRAAVPGAAAVALGQRVYAVLPDAGDGRAWRVVPQLLERIRDSLHRPVLIGVGGRVESTLEVPRSRAEADLVLRALANDLQDRRWAQIDQVRAQTVLLRLRDLAATDPHLTKGPLTTLVEADCAKDSRYIETLRAYLQGFGDVTVAAASLGVHSNTFRYRLRRLIEISGIDLDDPEQRLVAELQLQFL